MKSKFSRGFAGRLRGHRASFVIILSLLVHIPGCTPAENKRPENTLSWVMDHANVFNLKQDSILSDRCKSLYENLGPTLIIHTTNDLGGKSIEEYSLERAEEWRPGTPENNDGMLLIFALNERRVRIEVGYGLENIIRDEVAFNIIKNQIIPEFREGNYFEGTLLAVDSMTILIEQNRALIGSEPTWEKPD